MEGKSNIAVTLIAILIAVVGAYIVEITVGGNHLVWKALAVCFVIEFVCCQRTIILHLHDIRHVIIRIERKISK